MSADSTAPGVVYKVVPWNRGYRVGSDGSVWTCRRRISNSGPTVITKFWRKMKPGRVGNGYYRVALFKDGKATRVSVHRLILETFVGPCPPGHEAAHFPDQSKANNALANLTWKTKSKNYADRYTHGTENTGEKNGRSKLTVSQVLDIRARRGKSTGPALAKEYGVSKVVISSIQLRKSWKHV